MSARCPRCGRLLTYWPAMGDVGSCDLCDAPPPPTVGKPTMEGNLMNKRYVLLTGETVIEVPHREQYATEEVRFYVRPVRGHVEITVTKTINRNVIEWEIPAEIHPPYNIATD